MNTNRSQKNLERVKTVALRYETEALSMQSLAKALLHIPGTRKMVSAELECPPDLLFVPKPPVHNAEKPNPKNYSWPEELFEAPFSLDDELEVVFNFENSPKNNHDFGDDQDKEVPQMNDVKQLIRKITLNSPDHIWYRSKPADTSEELMKRMKRCIEKVIGLYPFDKESIEKLSALIGKQCFHKLDKTPRPALPIIVFTQTGEDELRLMEAFAIELTGKMPVVIFGASDGFDEQIEELKQMQPRIVLFRFGSFSNPGSRLNDLMQYFEIGKRHTVSKDFELTTLEGTVDHMFDKHIIILQLAYPLDFSPAFDSLVPVSDQLAVFMQDKSLENTPVFAESSFAERFLRLAKSDVVFTYQLADASLLFQFLIDYCERVCKEVLNHTIQQGLSECDHVHLAALGMLSRSDGSLTAMYNAVNGLLYEISERLNGNGDMMATNIKLEFILDAFETGKPSSAPDELQTFYSRQFEKCRNDRSNLAFTVSYCDKKRIVSIVQTGKSYGSSTNGNSYLIPKTDICFNDVIGLDEAKRRLQMIIDYLQEPKAFDELRVKPARRILLYGPPGSGKTMIAKAFSNHIKCPFYSISAAEITSQKYAGFGASLLRKVFNRAQQTTPCVIFLDELDAFGNRAGFNADSVGYDARSILTTLLVLLDGVGTDEDIIVLGATNRIDDLDPALLRPKRFGTCIQVELPENNLKEILIKRELLPGDCSCDYPEMAELIMSRSSVELSPARIEDIIAEAKLRAISKGNSKVMKEDLNEVIDDFFLGKKLKSISPGLKWSKSYHEAAHAILHRLLFPDTPIEKISVQHRSGSFGVTVLNHKNRNEMDICADEELLAQMVATLGGICAERKKFGRYAAASAESIFHALRIGMLLSAHMDFGKSNHSSLNYAFFEMTGGNPAFSDELRKQSIGLIEKAYGIANEMVQLHWNEVVRLAEALFEQEIVDKKTFESITWTITRSALDLSALYDKFRDSNIEIGYRKGNHLNRMS